MNLRYICIGGFLKFVRKEFDINVNREEFNVELQHIQSQRKRKEKISLSFIPGRPSRTVALFETVLQLKNILRLNIFLQSAM